MSIRTHELRDTRTHKRISIACALVSALGGCAWIFLAVLFAVAALRPSPALAAPGDMLWGVNIDAVNLPSTGDKPFDIAVDETGSFPGVYTVGCESYYNIYCRNYVRVKKMDLNGNPLWEKVATYGSSEMAFISVAVDATGVYMAGGEWDPVDGNAQWRIEKRGLDDGVVIWSKISDPSPQREYSTNVDEFAFGVAVDSTYLYVVGQEASPNVSPPVYSDTSWRIEKRRLDNGELCTAANCGTEFGTAGAITLDLDTNTLATDNQQDRAVGVAVDRNNNEIYVVGWITTQGSPYNSAWHLEKRRSDNGNLIWERTSSVAGNCWNPVEGIAIDSTGVYLAGWDDSPCASGSWYEWRIEKWDLDGNMLWRRLDELSPTYSSQRLYGVAVDNTGVYVTGYAAESWYFGYMQNLNLTNGSLLWSKTLGTRFAFGVDVGSSGVYLAGQILSGLPLIWRVEKREKGAPLPPPPTVNLSAFPATINSGESSTLSWDSPDADSCVAVDPPGWTSSTATSGAEVVWPAATTTYIIECTNAGGTTQQSTTVTVNVAPPPPSCGDLDTSFDGDGIVTSQPGGAGTAWVTDHAIDPTSNAMYIVGKDSWADSSWQIEKRRLDTGALITAFDSDGLVTNNPTPGEDYPTAIAIDSTSNAMYVVGSDYSPGNSRWRIEKRRLDNGALCTAANCGIAFDTDGVVTENITFGHDVATDIAIDSSANAMYVVGYQPNGSYYQWRIEKRRLDTGALITAFDSDGVVTNSCFDSNYITSSGYIHRQPSVVIDSASNAMYVVGADYSPSVQWRIEKRRLDNGALCTAANCGIAFDTDGVVTENVIFSTIVPIAIAIDSTSNAMYVVGSDYSPGNRQWRIEKRELDTGALITAFDSDGVATNNPSTTADASTAIAIDPTSNAMYVGGYDDVLGNDPFSDWRWRIEKRDLTTGNLIPDFGLGGTDGDGVVTSNPNAGLDESDYPLDITIDSTAIYVVGVGSGQWRTEKRLKSCTGAPPLPTIDLFTATPSTINSGDPSTLDWSTTGAASCTGLSPAGWITEGGGGGACSGTTSPFTGGCQIVQPVATTDYIIECYNAVGDPAQQTVRVTVNAPAAGNDCGMRVYDGTTTVTLDCENPATTTSLRIHKGGTTYGIKLVDPADPNASRLRIQTPDGIKALRRQ